ncbi:FliM/FliN family flagellar motor C-terminal domain-containing protein [Microbulbifer sp. GL-2]|uniref:FliM/FliN family flagellar motor switch protein n=1 Tax=Microbulbifer sp. GL-2 TaxID=2591606 RepID=UPI0011649087|nr:FliM/FliN family flagellar motor C-terminal domain-containing protein [Microbulbifer sp. GL-2]BBM00340.1 hypothetical protein GL2_04140 [Microbulbifer sp. GL-2]
MSESREIDMLELSEFNESDGSKLFDRINPKFLKGIEVEIKVEFGHTSIALEELTSLSIGNIVKLDAPSEQYVDLKIGDQIFAKGLLVVVDGCYGVKIEEVFRV